MLDASWTISVVLHTAPRTFRRFASSRFCRPCEPEGPPRVHSLCDVGLLSCGRAVRKRGNQLVMCSLCLVRMVKGSHALGGPLHGCQSMSCLCSSVWRLPERPCPNRFGLWAQRRAESRACKCSAVALCTTACSRWPTAQLGFAKEPALSDQAWMLAGAEASTRWASFVQPVCICCR